MEKVASDIENNTLTDLSYHYRTNCGQHTGSNHTAQVQSAEHKEIACVAVVCSALGHSLVNGKTDNLRSQQSNNGCKKCQYHGKS